ncbi:Fc receptor-like protein 2 [Equus quagga]|uniref:Fc receptor-like protein 2 n=1 Tax=Equus quagga TaxID=89248 RepID=UPI001EE2861A|nr:Fc receptor-like protein 2 [Equus quagga]
MYYKDASQISTYYGTSSYTVSNTGLSDNGSFYRKRGQAIEGKTLILVCSMAEGRENVTLSWHREDTRESLGRKSQCPQKAEQEIAVIRENHARGYYHIEDNGYGLTQSEAVNITISAPVSCPLLIFSVPGAQVFFGDTTELHWEDTRASPSFLYWFYHENVTLGNPSVSFGGKASFNLSLTAEHSGNYTCETDNGRGAK